MFAIFRISVFRQGIERYFGPGSAEWVLWPVSTSPKWMWGRRGRRASLSSSGGTCWVIRSRGAGCRSRSWPFPKVALHEPLFWKPFCDQRITFLKCFFTETELIKEFSEPITVEITEVRFLVLVAVICFVQCCVENYKRIIIFCPWLVRKQTVHSRWHLQQWRERPGRGVDCRDGGMLPHIPLTPGIYMKLHIKMEETLRNTVLHDRFNGSTWPTGYGIIV